MPHASWERVPSARPQGRSQPEQSEPYAIQPHPATIEPEHHAMHLGRALPRDARSPTNDEILRLCVLLLHLGQMLFVVDYDGQPPAARAIAECCTCDRTAIFLLVFFFCLYFIIFVFCWHPQVPAARASVSWAAQPIFCLIITRKKLTGTALSLYSSGRIRLSEE